MTWESRPEYLSILIMPFTSAIILMLAFVLWFTVSGSQIGQAQKKKNILVITSLDMV